jgi:hypothetical protein
VKYYMVGAKKPTETAAQKLERQLSAAAKGLILTMREARAAKTRDEQEFWLMKARRYKAYLERLGKNK